MADSSLQFHDNWQRKKSATAVSRKTMGSAPFFRWEQLDGAPFLSVIEVNREEKFGVVAVLHKKTDLTLCRFAHAIFR
jgi:hypothetical protein